MSFDERLKKKINLDSLAREFFEKSKRELEEDYLPSAESAWVEFSEFIGDVQGEIWVCEQEGSAEELEALEELDDGLRGYFQGFKKLFREKYPEEDPDD